jgi:hypothetical protein
MVLPASQLNLEDELKKCDNTARILKIQMPACLAMNRDIGNKINV